MTIRKNSNDGPNLIKAVLFINHARLTNCLVEYRTVKSAFGELPWIVYIVSSFLLCFMYVSGFFFVTSIKVDANIEIPPADMIRQDCTYVELIG